MSDSEHPPSLALPLNGGGDSKTDVLVIAGPTASGKSALALALAQRLRGTLINADSMQLYRELAVLSARPTPGEMALVPHRLFGRLPAAEPCSAGRWRELALDAIAATRAEGRLPILVGGTGLYLEALMRGIADLPAVPEEIRRRLQARMKGEGGLAALYEELGARDPAAAARIEPTDRQRILRALELYEATGKPLSAWQAEAEQGPPPDLAFQACLLMPPRAALYAACDRRFAHMVETGALEEVRGLLALGLDPALPAMKAIGVAELGGYLAGKTTLDEAVAAGQQATRRYAKRQFTWFRHRLPEALRIETDPLAPGFADEQFLERFFRKFFSKICR
ncbi:MAG TPA: tRNA (adenosine(37)-N6)-dimethylallyltransferase MiaA [Hypericibacter adhaerens]|jgi:tRNA dimethylallyltransferase|nr:tRNA (adenosine(37)-N6)-dimethylallyltransferase MiaA [Hypericibacter adhaerens]HWA45506.1 tRNA (adenosine(37)-N6)-dimethylallyltransferase MiaA [Hypericibacter adhaerens]